MAALSGNRLPGHEDTNPKGIETMKTALTRLAAATALALVFLTSACIGPSPTAPGGSTIAPTTVESDPPDDVITR